MPYQTRKCSIQELQPKLATAIGQYMSSDDRILACYETKYTEDLVTALLGLALLVGLPETSIEAQVVTQSQVIHARTSKDGNSASSIRLADILNIEETSSRGYYKTIVHSQGEATIWAGFASLQMEQKFANILRQAIKQARAAPTATSSPSLSILEDRLRVLTQLHKDGLISEAEFQQKRGELLNQL